MIGNGQRTTDKTMPYNIKLPIYEGPLDLLLHLIKKNKIDISDIPIALITHQYLEYLEAMKELNLEIAGEFLVMAATLLHIKSRMLLPQVQVENPEEEDPRTELVHKLIEYQKFRELALKLEELDTYQSQLYFRDPLPEERPDIEIEYEFEVSLFDLISAFHKALKSLEAQTPYRVEVERIDIQQKMIELLEILETTPFLSFTTLFKNTLHKVELIVLFLGILELAKLGQIFLSQSEFCGEIWIHRRQEGE
jgi:segregation and condensation protein A